MTDEMTVQGQRPSALPYVLSGAAVGGLGGAGLAKWTPLAFTEKYGKTWEEAVARTNADDSFVKSRIDKGGENKGNWEKIQEQAKNVKEAEKALNESVPEALRKEAAFTEYVDAIKSAINEKESLINKIREGKIAVEGHAKEDLAKMTNDQIKGLPEFTKESKEVIQKIEETLGAKFEALVKKAEELNVEPKDMEKMGKTSKEYIEVCGKASDTLTKDLLKACKKPSMLWTALAGAAVLGLGGLLLRPKAKDQ